MIAAVKLQIKLHHLGPFEKGDVSEFWVDAVGNSKFGLATLLAQFWCPVAVEGAAGPSIAIRFIPCAA